jgi:sialate O-acetylesterase
MPAGGPYTMRVTSGSEAQEIHDVLVGDVFLCTGQSNMQLNVRAAAKAAAEIAAATDDQVRELAVDRVPSAAALTTFTSPVSWKVESPQTAGDFSASCFYFARELRKTVKVPIGLVTVAWGGTRVRGWVSEPTLSAQGFFNDDLDMLALDQRDPVAASRRWDAAGPVLAGGISGTGRGLCRPGVAFHACASDGGAGRANRNTRPGPRQ